MLLSQLLFQINIFQSKKGVKRKADTTTPGSVVNANASFDANFKPAANTPKTTLPATIAGRRESHRQIKRPKKDLPEDHPQHSTKTKKRPKSVQLKYCHNMIKELFAKRHAVSII